MPGDGIASGTGTNAANPNQPQNNQRRDRQQLAQGQERPQRALTGPNRQSPNSNPNEAGGTRQGGMADPGRSDQLPPIDPNQTGPLTGGNYTQWSEQLRDVEDMLDFPDLRTQMSQVRERAQTMRAEFKQQRRAPKWDLVQTQIAQPLIEVRQRVEEELARREAKEALVPLDRDPVPSRYSELVRRYYEQLGKEP